MPQRRFGAGWRLGFFLSLALCCIDASWAIAGGDCQSTPEQPGRPNSDALPMRPSYYDMRSLRAISFTPRQRHCYFLLDAFAGQAAFR